MIGSVFGLYDTQTESLQGPREYEQRALENHSVGDEFATPHKLFFETRQHHVSVAQPAKSELPN